MSIARSLQRSRASGVNLLLKNILSFSVKNALFKTGYDMLHLKDLSVTNLKENEFSPLGCYSDIPFLVTQTPIH